MPTQEQINAANVELRIANDNYAATQARIDKYKDIFEAYKNASPETQAKAASVMQQALDDYNNLRVQQYANEDRITQAQNAVNAINEQIVQPTVTNGGGQRRRTIAQPTIIEQPVVEQPATYQVPQYTPTQHNLNLQKGIMPQQPAYTPLPDYVPQYQNNTLGGIARNFAGQSSRDWQQAGNEWKNVVWPNMKRTVNQGLGGVYNNFVKKPAQVATDVLNFTFGKPQLR